jgi:rubrerythrin
MRATKLVRRWTTRGTWRDANECAEFLRGEGYMVRSLAIDDEAERTGHHWLIIYERDEPVYVSCERCGYQFIDTDKPGVCDNCGHEED